MDQLEVGYQDGLDSDDIGTIIIRVLEGNIVVRFWWVLILLTEDVEGQVLADVNDLHFVNWFILWKADAIEVIDCSVVEFGFVFDVHIYIDELLFWEKNFEF